MLLYKIAGSGQLAHSWFWVARERRRARIFGPGSGAFKGSAFCAWGETTTKGSSFYAWAELLWVAYVANWILAWIWNFGPGNLDLESGVLDLVLGSKGLDLEFWIC